MSARLTIHDTGRRCFYASTAEAFRDATYAAAIQGYKPDPHRIVWRACWIALAIVGVLAWAGMLPGAPT